MKKGIFSIMLLIPLLSMAQKSMDISGIWQVKLDNNELIRSHPQQSKVAGEIILPASLAERGFGYKTEGSDFGILTLAYKYVGKAWYSREIEIPDSWKNKDIEVFLERVLWESRVIVDGRELSSQDALGTPHIHNIGQLPPGKHELVIMVDNNMIHNIGDKGHAYGEYTQSIWNGMVGKMEMRAYGPVKIKSVKTFPNIQNETLEIRTEIQGTEKAKLNYEIKSLTSGDVVLSGSKKVIYTDKNHLISILIPTEGKLKKWSEFTPEVYVLKLSVKAGKNHDALETELGYYQVSHNGTKILINGNPVFLRGNLDCVHFPLTGYASCEVKDWERIFRIYKKYGLNHARFHSWCPPEAAFKAANRVGIYLQAEASIWIDWWMSEDMVKKGRPEMDTKGHPKGLGHNTNRDKFVIAEMNRIVDTYGNHPSFTMFCIGNELGNSDFDVIKDWVANLKAKDPRRLYAVSTARKITPVDDYNATHYIQGIGRTRGLNGPQTDWDFEDVYSKADIPIIAHEIGQWPVYPKWSEIDKYTGVLKARNLQGFKAQAQQNGIADQDGDFAAASGALNQLMYKYETESFLRTASCAGVQLLSMQDYQGQGEALIGWLDAFWDSKGITTPEKFREHFNTSVPLLRMKKFVWTSDEIFEAKAQLSHHGPGPISAICSWKISNEKDQVKASGTFPEKTFSVGSLNDLGNIRLDLQSCDKAEKLTISMEMEGTPFKNEWNIWVYPTEIPEETPTKIRITDKLDDKTMATLQNGGKVLLVANELGTEKNSVHANFYPLYWSLTFFPGQGKTCLGLLLKENHALFHDFPTSGHSDWQWETISADAKGFVLNDLPASYKPIAQLVDDFHRNNKVGSIFELKVGNGSLLVCGYNLHADLPVARQLKNSILHYMGSDDFDPQTEVDISWIKQAFPSIPTVENVDVPKEFDGAILYVDAAAKLNQKSTNIPWKPEYDNQVISKGTSYQLKADGIWKDETDAAWYGKEMQLRINCPDGILGSLYVQFRDWNNNKRTGLLEFEGRKVKLEKHDSDGIWAKFHVMREDSNDGKLILKTKAQTGPNLMITKVVLVKE